MTSEVRRVRLVEMAGRAAWTWVDAVTGERGRAVIDHEGLEVGDELVVELSWGGGWRATRFIELPAKALAARLERPRDREELPSDPVEDRLAPRWEPPVVGEIRVSMLPMDGRTTAHRDAGRSEKYRPAVVVWVDDADEVAGVRFLYGVNSLIRRNGMGRRLRDWRAAGLRKPSVVETAEVTRSYRDLSECRGHLTEADSRRILGEPR